MERKYREHLAAFRIQCRWRKAYEDPTYTLCKKQLSDKFDALCKEYGVLCENQDALFGKSVN